MQGMNLENVRSWVSLVKAGEGVVIENNAEAKRVIHDLACDNATFQVVQLGGGVKRIVPRERCPYCKGKGYL